MTSRRDYASAGDGELIAWSAEGDRSAFDEVVVRHGPFALRMARRMLGDASAAEDVAQDALLRTWRRAAHFDPRRARFSTWLYRIVVNRCVDQRRRARLEPLPPGFDPPDPAEGAEALIQSRQRRDAVATALDALPARQRAAIALVYEEGLSGAEAAKALGLTPKAVERLLARARANLRESLQKAEREDQRC